MHVNWDTVATAGATAMFVTLVIEYLAKPRLEARKERILSHFRDRRDLGVLVTKISLAARRFTEPMPDDVEPKLRETWNRERDRQFTLMRELVLKLSDDVDRYARVYRNPVRELLIKYAFTLHGVVMSLRSRHRQAEIVGDLGVPMAIVIDANLRRPLDFQTAVEQVRELVAATQA